MFYLVHDLYVLCQQAGELASEKSRFEETVGAMSEQLMDFVEKMNKLEKESVSPNSQSNKSSIDNSLWRMHKGLKSLFFPS